MALEDLARKGKENFEAKLPTMPASYRASKDRAITNYKAVIPGPTRQRNYENKWAVMPDHYERAMTREKADKWYRNWLAKMKE